MTSSFLLILTMSAALPWLRLAKRNLRRESLRACGISTVCDFGLVLGTVLHAISVYRAHHRRERQKKLLTRSSSPHHVSTIHCRLSNRIHLCCHRSMRFAAPTFKLVPPTPVPLLTMRNHGHTEDPLHPLADDGLGSLPNHEQSTLLGSEQIHSPRSDEEEDEDHAREVLSWRRLPWWKRPSPYWSVMASSLHNVVFT